jgi:hypothetical protein
MQMIPTSRPDADETGAIATMSRCVPETSFTVDNYRTGVPFNVRIVELGQTRCGSLATTNDTGEPLIEFYDARRGPAVDTAGQALGTFIARLRIKALVADQALATGVDSLDLDSRAADWNLDLRGTSKLFSYLRNLGYVEGYTSIAAYIDVRIRKK